MISRLKRCQHFWLLTFSFKCSTNFSLNTWQRINKRKNYENNFYVQNWWDAIDRMLLCAKTSLVEKKNRLKSKITQLKSSYFRKMWLIWNFFGLSRHFIFTHVWICMKYRMLCMQKWDNFLKRKQNGPWMWIHGMEQMIHIGIWMERRKRKKKTTKRNS